MKRILYGLVLVGLSVIPATSDGYGYRVYIEEEIPVAHNVTLMATNMGGQEIDVVSVPYAEDFVVGDIQRAMPPGASWDFVQFSVRFYEGNRTIKTACSAYGEGQDAASYDMMIPTHQLPPGMRVLIRTHDFGGTPSYDCAVYPNLPYHFFRPRH